MTQGGTQLLGSIGMFAGNYAPREWMFCNGQLMPIGQNQALFSLLGTYYGGDGRTTFGLPDLRGRVPIHVGGSNGQGPGLRAYALGEKGGSETVTLGIANLPSHSHTATLYGEDATADKFGPKNKMLAQSSTAQIYTKPNPNDNKPMASESIVVSPSGGGQGFGIRTPYIGINFCIATIGLFPSRS